MITLQTLRDLTLSTAAAVVAADMAGQALRSLRQPTTAATLPPATAHGWLYALNGTGGTDIRVRPLRPATLTEAEASEHSADAGDGGWIALDATGTVYDVDDPHVLTHATSRWTTDPVDIAYVATSPDSRIHTLARALAGRARTARMLLAHLRADRAARLRIQARGPILQAALAGDTAVETTREDVRLTADVVALAERDGLTYVLLIRRGWAPYAGMWALPGGHVDPGETTLDAAHRELGEETGIAVDDLRLVGVYDQPGRDPRGRYVTAAYLTELADMPDPAAGDDAADAVWVPVSQALSGGEMAFDHAAIIADALDTAAALSGWHDEIAASDIAAYEHADLAPLTVDELLDEADEVLVQGQLADTELAAAAVDEVPF